MKKYDHKAIEKKWQDFWTEKGVYKADSSSSKPKKYILDMFPYPSGAGLHVGHPKGYIATDILSRMYRMQGFNVLHPMGWDAFGLPAEQFAIKNKIHPKIAVDQNVATFKEQLSIIGLDYDWEREVNTTDPEYYKWTQWAFLQMFKKGLAFESHEPINWCPSCKTGLANEDLEDGRCERCGSEVEKKPLRQWVIRITDYADRMLQGLDTLDKWPESVKTSQRNWIGRSEGAEIEFPLLIHNKNYVIPEFIDPKNPPIEGKNTKERKTIHAIVYSPQKDAYLTVKWKEYDWHAVIVGGVDNGENIVEAARREVAEESGYVDLKFEGILGGPVKGQYFAAHKDENRVALTTAVYFTLQSEKQIEISEEEKLKHDYVWVPREEFKPEEMTNVELPLWFERIEKLQNIKVFTTRADTLFGVTYIVLAPEHSLVNELKDSITNWSEVKNYIEETKKKSPLDRQKGEKTGVELQGVFVVNPANGEQVPVWIADHVLAEYGTGAVMAVPAHDERDFEFAKKYNLPTKEVISYYHEGTGDHTPKQNIEIIYREVVDAIIENQKGEFLFLKETANNTEKIHFVGGGIDGEDEIEALKKEIIEETGYTDFEIIEKVPNCVSAFGFHHRKLQNQKVSGYFFHVKLKSENRIESEVEEGRHSLLWVKKEQVKNLISWPHHLYAWEMFLNKDRVFTDEGVLINSGNFSGLISQEAKAKITEFVGGAMKTSYKLRDWVFSRQRYWGEPIPLVHVNGKVYPIPESELPLRLPEVENYEPSDSGESPLAEISEWVNVKGYINTDGEFVVAENSPNGEEIIEGRRETNTMPQWAGSCWYYLRYIDPKNSEALVNKNLEQYWQPVDVYVGGMEHATRHLIYARFWHKFLFDIGVVNTEEPFTELHAPGLILAEDGRKMSKRWGNVINPDDMVDRFGADAFRLYEAFIGPFDDAIAWNTDGLVGTRRFVERVVRISENLVEQESESVTRELHKLIKKATSDIPAFKFNTAVSSMMTFINLVEKEKGMTRDSFEKFIKILAPFAPHIAEELWQEFSQNASIHTTEWPKYDESKLIEDEVTIAVQINGKVRGKIKVAFNTSEEEVFEQVKNDESIARYIDGTPTKIIYVQNKLMSIVI